MLPTFSPGDLLLGYRNHRYATGDVVVVRRDRILIKRIKMIENDSYFVVGDNSRASTDSRNFGPVLRRELEAKIIARVLRA
jgi:phage repressor protein C with HTH and peptisase S24 domain